MKFLVISASSCFCFHDPRFLTKREVWAKSPLTLWLNNMLASVAMIIDPLHPCMSLASKRLVPRWTPRTPRVSVQGPRLHARWCTIVRLRSAVSFLYIPSIIQSPVSSEVISRCGKFARSVRSLALHKTLEKYRFSRLVWRRTSEPRITCLRSTTVCSMCVRPTPNNMEV